MVKLTMIARVTDGLPLVEGLDDGRDLKDADFYKQQAKLLFKNLSKGQHEASRMSIETGPYIIEGHVCYLTMCDHSYPKKLAFQYLEDLKNEFERVNGNQIETAARPYAFIKFGMALICKYAPVAIVIGIVLMLFWVKNKIWLMDGQGSYHPKLHGMSCDSDVLAAIEYVRLCCWTKVTLIEISVMGNMVVFYEKCKKFSTILITSMWTNTYKIIMEAMGIYCVF
uniref:Longin domain-containing protein n=1 Tax=Oryza glaberrima TaxID=4538 RepID=I1QHG9_ORYGL